MRTLGSRRVGAPVGHHVHQETYASSSPCNWSPRYYQVILYPHWVFSPEVRRLSSSRSSHIDVESIRRASRTVHQSPITMIPNPQVRILILIDIGPMIRANLPVIATMSLHATTMQPPMMQKTTNVMKARRGPIIAVFVAERTPWATRVGSEIVARRATHTPMWTSSDTSSGLVHDLEDGGNLENMALETRSIGSTTPLERIRYPMSIADNPIPIDTGSHIF